MSTLEYSNYPGYGAFARAHYGYSQAVRVGDRIEISGQGGWHPESGPLVLKEGLEEQIDQTFQYIDLAMRTAGGKGLSQVFQVRSYHRGLSKTPEVVEIMVKNLEKWFPEHRPLWTCIGVESLANPEMLVEIEAMA
ncbi:hypothetical protein SEUCBS139899_004868 [Sporothrix eucalyptigena]|uniref:Uncharacterized protein n=1 Tax=Sporothrix eucalyptigena TaxID=1812306 RepID=A0ABP0CXW3_9PEZI